MRLEALFVAGLAELVFAQSNPPRPAPNRMEIVVEQKLPAGVKAMDPGHVFESGDLVRFRFKANFSGSLYVMDQSTSGKYVLLFPKDETGNDNKVESGKEYLLPATNHGWFRVEGPAGYEIVYWVVSPQDLGKRTGERTSPIPSLPAPKIDQLPPGTTPRCDDTIFRARGDCVDTSAGVKPVAKDGSVPENLAPFSTARERDLAFLKQDTVSMVSSPEPLAGPVIYEFHLAHK
jgi:hypothetical protein